MNKSNNSKRFTKKRLKELIVEKMPEKDWIQLMELDRALGLKKGEKKRSILNAIYELEKDRIIKVKRYGRKGGSKATYLYLPEAEQIVKRKHLKAFETPKEIPLEIRRQHTNEIKGVIIEWIQGLGDIPSLYYKGGLQGYSHQPIKFHAESDPLFPCIEPHLTFKNDVFKKWEDFKKKLTRFGKCKRDLYSNICKKLSDKLQIEISDKWQNREMIHYDFPNLVYQALIELGRGDEDDFNSFLSFESRVGYDKKQGLGRYWVNANGFVIFKMSGSEEEHKKGMDNYVRTTLKGLRGSQLEKKMIKLMEKEGSLNKLKEEIVQILNRNLKVPLFGKECEICRELKTIL